MQLFRATEIRCWALAKPQHDIDALKDWTLKMAKKSRGGKKRGGGFVIKIKALDNTTTSGGGGGGGGGGGETKGAGKEMLNVPSKEIAGDASSTTIKGINSSAGGRRRRKKKIKAPQ